jgi:ornithine cyclodeaminase
MNTIPMIDAARVETLLTYPGLVDALDTAFRDAIPLPDRAIHEVPGGTLLMMPAWDSSLNLGVKIATVFPDNGAKGIPSTASTYLLLDGRTGQIKMLIDGAMLTNRRTAGASALASRYLSRPDSRTLTMVGAGALAAHLIEAHCSVRPIERVTIWARSLDKARALAQRVRRVSAEIRVTADLAGAVAESDIISCATLSTAPLVRGAWLVPGQHVDLVGGFKPDMREVDTDAVARATLYADTRAGVLAEAGDYLTPMHEGRIGADAIRDDLFGLCAHGAPMRRSGDEITMFKSVGAALEDLAAAVHLLAAQRTPILT